jgi:adenosine kinase
MMRSYENHVRDVSGVSFGIVSPDGREGMLQNAAEFLECGIPFIFDPGQAMPLFNGAELRNFIEQADYVTVNDYESNLLQERTGWNESEIASRVKAYITTCGPKGREDSCGRQDHRRASSPRTSRNRSDGLRRRIQGRIDPRHHEGLRPG